ncbi:MAG: hypothetical protein WAW39_26890 [Prosthecobacter sp.]
MERTVVLSRAGGLRFSFGKSLRKSFALRGVIRGRHHGWMPYATVLIADDIVTCRAGETELFGSAVSSSLENNNAEEMALRRVGVI